MLRKRIGTVFDIGTLDHVPLLGKYAENVPTKRRGRGIAMYTLIWDKHGFDVHRENAGLTPAGAEGDEFFGLRRPETCSVSYAEWSMFMRTGNSSTQDINHVLKDSWTRCRNLEVDPGPRKCWNFLPLENLEPKVSRLRNLLLDVEGDVYTAIRDRDLLMTVTTADGYVIRTCGDPATLKQADTLNFGPGALWAESSVGTNAIGTALATGKPTQVFGHEHYCESHHKWSCSAAPFFDPLGNIVGCFDISGPSEGDHTLALTLVLDAVRALEKRLFQQHCAELEHRSGSLVAAAFNSVLTGMLSIDCRGVISDANIAAETILGMSGRRLKGQPADNFFDYGAFLAVRQDGMANTIPMPCRVNPRLMARATPMYSLNGTWVGTVVAVMEPQRAPQRERSTAPALEPTQQQSDGLGRILGRSPAIAKAIGLARKAARTPSTVLLTGESGTGKELFARGIHAESSRADGPFVAVNCGAIAAELIQSELFGYAGGSFTGADRKGRPGKFELADKGTLFLDEIGEMPMSMQVNLLRVLEERRVTRVGGNRSEPVDVKIVAATNKDLEHEAAQGRFRPDLLYRLNVVRIHIPPLRERGDDIDILARAHASRLAGEFALPFQGIEAAALERLRSHHWPGNVRELINALEHALNAMEGHTLRPDDLAEHLRDVPPGPKQCHNSRSDSLRGQEADIIRDALERHGGNISRAARQLGIGRNTLYAKMRRLGIFVHPEGSA
jgi:transcriptional regulator of acetoin/glycerol metabolism